MKTINDLAAAAASDNAHFEALADACRPMIQHYLRRIGFRCPTCDRDDLLQVALLAVHEALAAWKPDLGSFSTLAGRVVHRRLLNAVKRHAGRTVESLPDTDDGDALSTMVPDPSPCGEEGVDAKDEAAAILATLSPDDRDLVERLAAGQSYTEIALARGTNAKAVDNAVQRIRRHARGLREAA